MYNPSEIHTHQQYRKHHRAFNRDLVVLLCHLHPWSSYYHHQWWRCDSVQKTREMFASSVFTIVLPELQFLLALIAATIWDSICMTKKVNGFVLVRRENQKIRDIIDARMLLERNNEPQESKVNHALSEKVPGLLYSQTMLSWEQIEWRDNNWTKLNCLFSLLKFHNWQRLKLCFLPRLMMQTSSWSMQLWTSLQDAVLIIGWILVLYTQQVLIRLGIYVPPNYWHIVTFFSVIYPQWMTSLYFLTNGFLIISSMSLASSRRWSSVFASIYSSRIAPTKTDLLIPYCTKEVDSKEHWSVPGWMKSWSEKKEN